jgi:purine-binding chemotaxis protein CheW
MIENPNDFSHEPDDEQGETAAGTHQFVTFLVGDEVFAVDMAPVQEIIRVPSVVRVPLAPYSLVGLASLRGRVLPIICLRRIFGFEERSPDDSTRAIVIDLGQPMGFVVDRVASVLNVETDRIKTVDDIRSTVNSDLLTGMLRDAGGYAMVMVLEFGKLIAREFAGITAWSHTRNQAVATSGYLAGTQEDIDSDEWQLVSFSVADQEYAIDIARVNEIVQIPDTIVHVPNSLPHVLGLMTLRERLLPLVSLRCLFHLPTRPLDEKSRIVVVTLGTVAVGIVTDSVSEVLRVPLDQVDTLPALLAQGGELSEITQICRLQAGRRLVSIISVDHLFCHSAVREALDAVAALNAPPVEAADQIDTEDEEQVVVFLLASGEFGVPIESVQEIVRVPEELTHVPKSPDFIEGVINLRGSVLPVIDQRKRLDLPTLARNDRQRIMVFQFDGFRTGLIVDAVTEVLKIALHTISPAPRLSGEQARLLGRVVNLEQQGRMIQLINPAHLIDGGDSHSLAAMNTVWQ